MFDGSRSETQAHIKSHQGIYNIWKPNNEFVKYSNRKLQLTLSKVKVIIYCLSGCHQASQQHLDFSLVKKHSIQ